MAVKPDKGPGKMLENPMRAPASDPAPVPRARTCTPLRLGLGVAVMVVVAGIGLGLGLGLRPENATGALPSPDPPGTDDDAGSTDDGGLSDDAGPTDDGGAVTDDDGLAPIPTLAEEVAQMDALNAVASVRLAGDVDAWIADSSLATSFLSSFSASLGIGVDRVNVLQIREGRCGERDHVGYPQTHAAPKGRPASPGNPRSATREPVRRSAVGCRSPHTRCVSLTLASPLTPPRSALAPPSLPGSARSVIVDTLILAGGEGNASAFALAKDVASRTLELPGFDVLSVLSVGALVNDATGEPARTALTFQEGAEGYEGTEDAEISTQYLAAWNDFKGNTYRTGFITVGLAGTDEFRGLLRFRNIHLPADALLRRATLRLAAKCWSGEILTVQAFYLRRPWNLTAPNLSWRYFNDSAEWALPGVDTGPGSNDTLAIAPVEFSVLCNGLSHVSVPLNPVVVRRWIERPSTNHGLFLLLAPSTSASSVQFYSADMAESDLRPALELEFQPAPYDPSGGLPSLVDTARIANVNQTAIQVVWTPPLFTAGQRVRNFMVAWSSTPDFPVDRTEFTELGPLATNLTIAGLAIGVPVFVQVAVANGNGYSGFKPTTPRFLIPAGVPTAPRGVEARPIGPSSVRVRWNPPAENGGTPVLSYLLAWGHAGGVLGSRRLSHDAREFVIEELVRAQPVSVAVAAANAVGAGPLVTLEGLVPNFFPPSAPNAVRAWIVNDTTVRVEWRPPTDDGGSPVLQYCLSVADGPSSRQCVDARLRRTELVVFPNSTVAAATPCVNVTVAAVTEVGPGEAAATNPWRLCPTALREQRLYIRDGAVLPGDAPGSPTRMYNATDVVSLTTINGLEAWNEFNGASFLPTAEGRLNVFNQDGSVSRLLLRFRNLSHVVPPRAVVIEAKLHLTLRHYNEEFEVLGQYLRANWSLAACCSQYRHVGWRYRDQERREWSGPGIDGPNDTWSDLSFRMEGFPLQTSLSFFTKTVPLDQAVVQGWVDGSRAIEGGPRLDDLNHGLVLRMVTPGKRAELLTHREPVFVGLRPTLELLIQVTENVTAPQPIAPRNPRPDHVVSEPRFVFVDAVNGSDLTGSGSIAEPFQTLKKGLREVVANDTLVLRGGIYAGGVNVDRSGITVSGMEGERVVIVSPMDISQNIVVGIRESGTAVTLRNLEIQGGYHYGILVYGTPNVVIENCRIHHTGNSAIKVKAGSHGFQIRHSRVHHAGFRIKTYGHGIDVIGSDRVRIEDNYVSDVPNTGIQVAGGSRGARVLRNVVANTGLGGIHAGWYTEVDEFGPLGGNSELFESIDAFVANNIIANTEGAGVAFYASLRPAAVHNTLWFTAQSMQNPFLLTPVQHWVSNNVYPITGNVNATVRHNVAVKSASARKGPMLQIRTWTDWSNDNNVVGGLAGLLDADYNVYSVLGVVGAQPFRWGVGVMLEDERKAGLTFVGNLSMWKEAKRWDLHSREVPDPLLDAASYGPVGRCSPAAELVPLGLMNLTRFAMGPAFASVPPQDLVTDFGGVTPDRRAVPLAPIHAGAVQDGPRAAERLARLRDAAQREDRVLAPADVPEVLVHVDGWVDYTMTVWAAHTPREIVVSPTGNDATGNGTWENPWRTLGRAISPTNAALPGDTVILRAGRYAGGVPILMPNLTITAAPGERVVIASPTTDSSVSATLRFILGGNNWNEPTDVTLRGLEIEGGYYYALFFNQYGGGSSPYWRAYLRYRGLSGRGYTLVEDCYLHHSGTSVVKMSPNADGIVFRRTEIAHSGQRVPTARARFLGAAPTYAQRLKRALVGTAAGNPDEVVVDPSKNTGTGGSDYYDGSDGGLDSEPAVPLPTNTGSGNGIDNRNADRVVVEDSFIHDIRGVGILMGGGAKDCVVRRTVVADVAVIGIQVGSFNTELEWMDVLENPHAFQNIHARVENNVVVRTGGAGVAFYSALNATAAHNTLVDVARTMHAAVLFNLSPQDISGTAEVFPANRAITFTRNVIEQAVHSPTMTVEARAWQPTASKWVRRSREGPNGTQCAAAGSPANATQSQWVDVRRQWASPAGATSPHEGRRLPNGACPLFPADNEWNREILNDPVHPQSSDFLASIGVRPSCGCVKGVLGCVPTNRPCGFLHPDFGGSGVLPSGVEVLYGIPIVRVRGSQVPAVPVEIGAYPEESDPGPFPIPHNASIEGAVEGCSPAQCPGDRHVLVIDEETCVAYEMWHAEPKPNGQGWRCDAAARFNLTSNRLRPLGWTSADAAGLSITAGLVKYDEVVLRGEIRHAIRMTVELSQLAYVQGLATHYAAYSNDPAFPPMGLRLRLKSSFNCSALRTQARVVCVALQRYGAIVADNGANWFLSGEAHPGWDAAQLEDVKLIPGSEMEAVYTGPLCLNPECDPVVPPEPLPTFPALDAEDPNLDLVWHSNAIHRRSPPFSPARNPNFVNRDLRHYVSGNWSAWVAVFGGAESDRVLLHDPGLSRSFVAGANLPTATAGPEEAAARNVIASTDWRGAGEDGWAPSDFFRADRPSTGWPALGAVSAEPTELALSHSPFGSRFPSLQSIFEQGLRCHGAGNTSFPSLVVDAGAGNDSECHPSAERPLRSLLVALTLIEPGGTILLRNGTYNGAHVLGVENVTITGPPDGAATLRASILRNEGSPLTIVPAGSGAVVQNVRVEGGFFDGLVVRGASRVLIQHVAISKNGHAGVKVEEAMDVTVRDSAVADTGQVNQPFGHGIVISASGSVVLRNNNFTNLRAHAISVGEDSWDVAVEANLITHSTSGISVGHPWWPSRIMDFQTYDPIDTTACRSDADTNRACHAARSVTVTNNVLVGLAGAGLRLAGARDVVASHNTLVDVARYTAAAVDVYAIQSWDTRADLPEGSSRSPIAGVEGLTFTNNLVSLHFASTAPVLQLHQVRSWEDEAVVVSAWNASTLVFGGNVFGKTTNASAVALPFVPAFYQLSQNPNAAPNSGFGTLQFEAGFSSLYVRPNDGSRVALNAWLATAGLATVPTSSPALTDSLQPTESSSARNAGVAAGCVDLDAVGRSRACDANPDAGAFEFAGETSAPGTPEGEAPPVALNVSLARVPPTDAAPGSCLSRPGPRRCELPHCWIPGWHAASPSGWDEDSVWDRCLNRGSMFPRGNSEWNRDITGLPRHPLSDAYVANMGASKHLHPDFGSFYGGQPMGFLYTYVTSAFPKRRGEYLYRSESDDVPYPLAVDAPIEGGACSSLGDRHALIVDKVRAGRIRLPSLLSPPTICFASSSSPLPP